MSSLAARLDRFVRWFFNSSPEADIDSRFYRAAPRVGARAVASQRRSVGGDGHRAEAEA